MYSMHSWKKVTELEWKMFLQNWARRKDLDVDAVLVVLQHLESLEHVVDCTADVLKRIHVDESIKLEILKFFGPILSQSTNSRHWQ